MRVRGGVILATVVALTTPGLASAGVSWGGNEFQDYEGLCGWLTARGARCDTWIVRHAPAWQRLQRVSAPKERVLSPAVAERDPASKRWLDSALLGLAAALLAGAIIPAPVTLRAWAGPRLLEGRFTLGAVGSTLLVTSILLRMLS